MNLGKKSFTGFLLLFPFLLMGQTVDFSFSTDDGLFCHPQRVNFTQLCSGTPDGFIWRFGNGASGIQPNESMTYATPGTYAVTLIAIYSDVAISVTKNVVINPTPQLTVIPDRKQMCQPGLVNVTATGSPFVTTYEWNFGDGSPSVTTGTNNSSHTYTGFGDFVITVKGTTAAGCTDIDTDTVNIHRFGIREAGISPEGGCIPINIQLDVIPDPPLGDPVINYLWNFGDGSPTINTPSPSIFHLYNTTAPITTASVTMTSASGCTSQYTYSEFGFGIPPTDPVAVTMNGQSTYCASETIMFSASATNANYYVWQWGDGLMDSVGAPIIVHRYRTLGAKQVIMIPYFNGCAGTPDTIDLNIIGVVANYKSKNFCEAKSKYEFTNLSLGNVHSFRWTFSDVPGSPDFTNYNVTHTFPPNGTFTTKFYLFDDITGCSDSLETTQYTATPTLTISSSTVCKDSLVTYTVLNPYPPGSEYMYAYHLNGVHVAHSFQPVLQLKPYFQGYFNEFVVISGPDSTTCDDTIHLPNPTRVGGPVMDWSMPASACLKNNSFPIVNNTRPFFPADTIVRWDWDFGDFTYSDVKTPPAHVYPYTGTFWMYFKATDKLGCVGIDSQFIRVYPTPEIYVLPRYDTLCSGDSLDLYSFTVDQFLWTPDYNISCLNCDTVKVKPAISTNYISTATNIFGCSNTDTAKIKVYEPFDLRVSPADTSFCIGGTVQLTASTNGYVTWSPPDFLSAINIYNPRSSPDTSITYKVVVSDSAGCFIDSANAVIHVNYEPTVDAGSDQVIPYYQAFTLNPAYSSDVSSYRWTPSVNSLNCITCATPSGIANQSTTYKIEVANIHGCKAVDEVAVIVACSKANLNLPTAFTPDNDGLNDWFYPLTRGYKHVNRFAIYNRWGNKIFERSNFTPNVASLGWDGKGKNKQPVDAGVFVWVIDATCDMGEKVELKGTVLLVR
jgi:gliding motility-associated-like protein